MVDQRYQSFLDTITNCALECKYCADSCQDATSTCARLCRDCADICWISAAALMNRSPQFVAAICKACIDICRACVRECEMDQSQASQACAAACQRVVREYNKISGLLLLQIKVMAPEENGSPFSKSRLMESPRSLTYLYDLEESC